MATLLRKKTSPIGRPAGDPERDRFPESLAAGTPEALAEDLVALLGAEQVHSRPLDLVRFSSDAGPYRLCPQVVVSPRDVEDVRRLFEYCRTHGRHATFRSGGSSLNGQAQGDDILIDVRRHFRGMELEGELLRARPGEVLAGVQNMLAAHGRRFGPDPASASIATIGGILSNNSGGMRCTVEQDSYHSLVAATLILPSGTVVDTSHPDAEERLARQEPELVAGLMALREEILADQQLVDRLRRKYTIRNTNSIRLDAFLDGTTPVQILRRLMVGAEGTLGFIAEAVVQTQRRPTVQAVSWVMLPNVEQASGYVHQIMEAGADACELLVGPVLRESVGNFRGAHPEWAELPDEAAALLVEVSGYGEADLEDQIAAVEGVLAEAELTEPLTFIHDPQDIAEAWAVRGGLYPLMGRQRPQGTALITEDLCVPPARIGEAAMDLVALLRKYDYPDYVMGHAAFGNLHFFLTPDFDDDEAVAKYAAFIEEFVELILDRYDGSLKAEHGTGMAMAPFVEREWGSQAFALMWRVKDLLDPHGVLAPNVKLTHDQDIHLRNFKSVPRIEEIADDCVECGFCESVCPSRNITVTPRERIVLRREMARQPEGSELLAALQRDYRHDAVDLCAADGTCAVACPVSIDTGRLMKDFRELSVSSTAERTAVTLAQRWSGVETAARLGLGAAGAVTHVLGEDRGTQVMGALTDAVRRVLPEDLVPTARHGLPPAAERSLPETSWEGAAAVYFPACINRMFGRAGDGPSLPETLVLLGERAGKTLVIPDDVAGTCCATPFSSKGYREAKRVMAQRTAEDLWNWSRAGRLPIVVDASSCTHGILSDVRGELSGELLERFEQVEVLDAVTWVVREVLPEVEATVRRDRVAVHPTCSAIHLDIVGDLRTVASFVAEDAFVPAGATCCGTAGDRGLLHPELVESATREERDGLERAQRTGGIDAYVSANRTCELGLTQATGFEYEHVLHLLEEATR